MLPSCFRPDINKFFKVFPPYSKQNIMDMQYSLLHYRGWLPNKDTLSADFFYLYSKLQKDSHKKNLDPYPYKIMGSNKG